MLVSPTILQVALFCTEIALAARGGPRPAAQAHPPRSPRPGRPPLQSAVRLVAHSHGRPTGAPRPFKQTLCPSRPLLCLVSFQRLPENRFHSWCNQFRMGASAFSALCEHTNFKQPKTAVCFLCLQLHESCLIGCSLPATLNLARLIACDLSRGLCSLSPTANFGCFMRAQRLDGSLR